MKNIKFEHVFAIALLIIVSIALFIFRDNKDLVMAFATALVGAFASITTFFFTKYTPQNQSFTDNSQTFPQETPSSSTSIKDITS